MTWSMLTATMNRKRHGHFVSNAEPKLKWIGKGVAKDRRLKNKLFYG